MALSEAVLILLRFWKPAHSLHLKIEQVEKGRNRVTRLMGSYVP